jgi:hypothetical protein
MIPYQMIRNKLSLLAVLCLAMLILPGCASQAKVLSDFDSRHDFTQNRTFTWAQDPPMLRSGDYIVPDLTEARMTAAIKGELIAKGYTFVEDQANADFSVIYTMGARDKTKILERPNAYYTHQADSGWAAPYLIQHNSDIMPYTYTVGVTAVYMFGVKTKQPISHAKSTKRLSNKDLRSNGKNAVEMASSLLQHFPVIGCEIGISKECKQFGP